ncbi:GerMN domain-containing protein [Lachnospiraceae bacterium OttesenSCG-928-E19]|nr:GerMN domain-containing protein [Lachnospiraceae bacterium OttesenSCG-928-E19]
MRRIGIILLSFICTALLFACKSEEEKSPKEPFIYYVNIDASDLVKVNYGGEVQYGGTSVDEMMSAIVHPEDLEKCQSPLPKGVEIQSYQLEGDLVTIDFSQSYYKMDKAREVLLRASIVKSLTQIEGVNWVMFQVSGAPMKDADGKEYGFMHKDDFVQNTGSSIHSYQQERLTLYFANEEGTQLVKEVRTIQYNSNIAIEKVIIEQILKGPSTEGKKSTIDPATKVLNISIADGICYVNFDEGIQTIRAEVSSEVALYSIVNSILANEVAEQVQVSVNGDTAGKFQNTIDLEKPFSSNQEIIAETE